MRPIDDWMQRHSGRPVDEDGAFAATGKVDDAALDKMLANPFFDRVPPKSLDRMDFGMEAVEGLVARRRRRDADRLHRRVASPGRASIFPNRPRPGSSAAAGGTTRFLMAMLKARVNAPVLAAEDAGWDGDALEAEGFAYLAMRSKKGLPLSLPTTTGVQQPMTGGKFHRKPNVMPVECASATLCEADPG